MVLEILFTALLHCFPFKHHDVFVPVIIMYSCMFDNLYELNYVLNVM